MEKYENNIAAFKKSSIKYTTLIRMAALLLMIGGSLYMIIQLIHPADTISSVNTSRWFLVACLTSLMSLFFFIGITGSYLLQAERIGIIGFVSYLTFALFWLISMIFSFNEAFMLPLLATDAPGFVEGILGLFSASESQANLGVFPALAAIAGLMYVFGGLIYGVMSYRSGVLKKYASLLLSVAAIATLATSIVPHPFDRLFAYPMGLALLLVGFHMWRNV
jgi:hypothetical protein